MATQDMGKGDMVGIASVLRFLVRTSSVFYWKYLGEGGRGCRMTTYRTHRTRWKCTNNEHAEKLRILEGRCEQHQQNQLVRIQAF